MLEQPYWWDAAEPEPSPTPMPDRAAVAIIGGGFTGLSAALTLSRLGHQAVVLDAQRIGWGASSRNGGAVSGGLKIAGSAAAAALGPDGSRRISEAAAASFPFLETLIAREDIACDYRRTGRFTAAWSAAHLQAMAAKAPFLAELTGMAVRTVPESEMRAELNTGYYRGGMVTEAAGAIHPAKYVRGLAQAAARAGATLVSSAAVSAIRREGDGFRLQTSQGELVADAVLMATNGYTAGGPMPWLTRRLLPVASYIIATEPLDPALVRSLFPTGRVIGDSKSVLNYFRPSPDGTRVIWGGRASFRDVTARQAAPVLARTMARVFPALRGVRLSHAWRGNVAFTFDFLPHLGRQDGIHYAAGCQGSGVAMMSWLGHQAGLRIAGAANEPFALADLPVKTMPGYGGRPWFLPAVGGWYRLRDWLARRA